MNVEIIIYIYGAVCVSMILFHFVTILVSMIRRRTFLRSDLAFSRELEKQLLRISRGLKISQRDFRHIKKRLMKVKSIQTFEDVMEKTEYQAEKTIFLRLLTPHFYHILYHYKNRDVISASYIATVIRNLRLYDFKAQPQMELLLLGLLQRNSIYLREAVLGIFYDEGNTRMMMDALRLINDKQIFHHPKLIHDGLLKFSGDQRELQESIFSELSSFRESLEVALLNFIRFSNTRWDENFFALLTDSTRPDEVRFCCIRYFGNHAYPPAERVLQAFVMEEEKRRWEYAAISAAALKNYKNDTTKWILTSALNSPSWYVRSNSAQSLQAMGFTYTDLLPILDGNNRYAREIMRYWLDMRDAKEAASL